MVPPAPRECNQPARSASHRKQSTHRAVQRIGLRIPCITAHRANATSPRAAHLIANNPRTVQRSASACASRASQRTARMQPARAQRIASQTIRAPCSAPPAPITSPPRIARSARRAPRTCSTARASQYFALVYLVRGTNFSKIQFKYIAN
jgi:hypothetical protein